MTATTGSPGIRLGAIVGHVPVSAEASSSTQIQRPGKAKCKKIRQTRGCGAQGWFHFCVVNSPISAGPSNAGVVSAALLASGFSDEFVEHLPHRRRIAVHDGGGGRDVAVGVEVLPVEDEAGVAGELLEEGTLGPAVALAERVDGVDLAEVVGQPLGERIPRKASQEALAVRRPEDVSRRGGPRTSASGRSWPRPVTP